MEILRRYLQVFGVSGVSLVLQLETSFVTNLFQLQYRKNVAPEKDSKCNLFIQVRDVCH